MNATPEQYHVVIYSYHAGHRLASGKKSLPGHIFAGFYKNYLCEAIKGHGPNRKSNLDETHHLADYQHMMAFPVTQEQYEKALGVSRRYYLGLVNDCVTYVNRICEEAGLDTPTMLHCILTPIAYYDYIREHNTPDPGFIPGRKR